jgi:signal peptidase I
LCWKWSASVTERRGWLWRWYGLFGAWALLVIVSYPLANFARSFYLTFYSTAESMAPTLEIGDRFLVRLRDHEPIGRGDVVVVRLGNFQYVKRVAAVPGDSFAMHLGVVILSGEPVAQHAMGQVRRQGYYGPETANLLHEQFPGEAAWHAIYDLGPTPQDNVPEVQLGNSQYFLLGDNRDNTADSRLGPDASGLGIVDREQIEGRALFRYWRNGFGLANGPL